MNVKPLVLAALSVFTLTSCSFHYGTASAGSAMITNDNFNIDFAYGTAKTTKILGIGSFNRDGLVLDAKKNLYANYPLQPGQALGNMTIDFKTTFVLVVSTTKVTISAEVIDFSDDAQNYEKTKMNIKSFSELNTKLTNEVVNNKPSITSNYNIGQKVIHLIDNQEVESTVIGAENNLLLVEDSKGNQHKVSPNDLISK